MYDPWRHAHTLGLTVELSHHLRPRGTYRDGLIRIRSGLSARERRVTLAHEIIHHERGDDGAACSRWHLRKQERAVHLEAARRLLPVAAIISARTDVDPASALHVDDYTLALRLANLDADEAACLDDARRIDLNWHAP